MKKIAKKILEVVTIFAIAFAIAHTFRIAQVSGESMNPTLQNGDYLIVFALGEPQDQDIVILNTEGTGLKTEYIVKRYYADKSNGTKIWLEGDNKENSLDSRVLGKFEKDKVLGRVLVDVTQKKVF